MMCLYRHRDMEGQEVPQVPPGSDDKVTILGSLAFLHVGTLFIQTRFTL